MSLPCSSCSLFQKKEKKKGKKAQNSLTRDINDADRRSEHRKNLLQAEQRREEERGVIENSIAHCRCRLLCSPPPVFEVSRENRCTLESFLDGHIRAFHYLGGVPAEVLYDNMKHVVIRRLVGKVSFNPELLHFAHHYGFAPKACPPYAAWVKGKVERPVDYIRESFWRGYAFNELLSANRDLHHWLDTVANRRIHGTHRQPVIERWQQEKPQLGPLPATDYDTSLKLFRKVYKDCQVSYDTNRYLLPHTVVGKQVLLKVKNGTIHFFDDDRLLVSYAQAEGKHQLVGNPSFYEALKADKDLQRRKSQKGCQIWIRD